MISHSIVQNEWYQALGGISCNRLKYLVILNYLFLTPILCVPLSEVIIFAGTAAYKMLMAIEEAVSLINPNISVNTVPKKVNIFSTLSTNRRLSSKYDITTFLSIL